MDTRHHYRSNCGVGDVCGVRSDCEADYDGRRTCIQSSNESVQ